ncbi:high mobility group box domain-containing protein, partial [Lentinula edodes]
SHARKQPAGHIPRPRNAFILFRCDFVRQKKVPDHVEANHRNISRIVGSVWKSMSASQKAPWIAMAEIEKKNHAKAHPGYKYHPGYEGRGRESQIKKVLYSTTEPISGK